jgi:cell division protein FtsL
MATAALTLPRRRRRPRNLPAAGRATFPEIYFVKHIDNSRLRREVDLEKRRECFSLLGLGILVFLFVLLFAWQHFQCVRNGYQIEQLKAERAALEEWNHQLRLEQASLADPLRIDTLARRELGLAVPSPQQVIQVGGAEGAGAPPESPELARNFFAGGEENPGEP